MQRTHRYALAMVACLFLMLPALSAQMAKLLIQAREFADEALDRKKLGIGVSGVTWLVLWDPLRPRAVENI